MPRPPIHSPLPALREVLPDFDRLQRTTGKAEQIADALRGVAQNGRAPENLPFYSTREIAGFFGVSQQTATFAVARLEHEGLVRRIRGSQTLLLGRRSLARAPARAVAAIPLETMESRYSYLHIRLSRELTDNLWKHRILADIVPYADPSLDPTHSQSPLDERLIRHRPDFVIWIAPLPTRRDVLLRLNDQGVRNLIVGFDADRGIPPHIVIDLLPTCRRFLEQQWRAAGIRVVRIIRSTILRRERAATLAALAAELGFDADILTSTSQLPRQLDKMYRRNSPIGIVLPDERSAAEFAFFDPATFCRIVRRHRVLFANNWLNIPFAGDGQLRIDRILIQHPALLETVSALINRWCARDFSSPVRHVRTNLHAQAPIWQWF